MKGDISTLADSVFQAVKGYCSTEFGRMFERAIEPFQKRLEEIPAGKDGAPGPQGEKGIDGSPGQKGDPGIDGKDGAPGEIGPQGIQGIQGEKGIDGSPGRDGEKGADGLQGPQGPAGEPGPQGEKGEKGDRGDPGEPGQKGMDGLLGEAGRDGRDGKDGAPGRDALQIEFLPAIDETRSYPRSTYAFWNGGVIRSMRTTDPVGDSIEAAGWAVMVEGIKEFSVEQTDERSFTIKSVTTSGRTTEKHVSMPVLIDKGVYKSDESYVPGDVTTWDGSMWIAREATQDKPGTSEAWRLSVKRGRDGRDGIRGEKGERGAEGRAGRDLTQMTMDGRRF